MRNARKSYIAREKVAIPRQHMLDTCLVRTAQKVDQRLPEREGLRAGINTCRQRFPIKVDTDKISMLPLPTRQHTTVGKACTPTLTSA